MKYGTYETYKIANADFTGLKFAVVRALWLKLSKTAHAGKWSCKFKTHGVTHKTKAAEVLWNVYSTEDWRL